MGGEDTGARSWSSVLEGHSWGEEAAPRPHARLENQNRSVLEATALLSWPDLRAAAPREGAPGSEPWLLTGSGSV